MEIHQLGRGSRPDAVPRHVPRPFRAAESATTLAGYVAALDAGTLAAAPGTRWAYCNANYEVAARLVEVASGRSFGEYMEQRVFGPLGMTGSAVGDQAVEPSKGFNSLFGAWVPRSELRDSRYASGSGGVITDATGMGRWLISQTGNGRQLVRPQSLQTMHTPSGVRDYGTGRTRGIGRRQRSGGSARAGSPARRHPAHRVPRR